MKKLHKLIKHSAKKSFQLLRDRAPLNCNVLGGKVKVTRLFYSHITQPKRRNKTLNDLMERLLIIPFIDDILNDGTLLKSRKNLFFRISKTFGERDYTVIIIKRYDEFLLLSCFIK